MFERFRIKAALRVEVVKLRPAAADRDALAQAELIFFEPAFVVAPLMRQRRWTAEQAMVFMVTDVMLEAERQGNISGFARDEPGVHAALESIYRHVVARAEADPALAPCISRPEPGQSAPFTGAVAPPPGRDARSAAAQSDTRSGSGAVDAIVVLSVAEGNRLDPAAGAAADRDYGMAAPMSDTVRQAGEDDPALEYLQTMGATPPREGFIDEAADAIVTFPFSDAAIAEAQQAAAGRTTWRFGLGMIALAVGVGELYRGVLHGPFDALRTGVGVLFLILSIMAFRSHMRVRRRPL